jgi:hypothetical protein
MTKSISIRKIVLLAALRLSTVWDLVTTFLGILIVLAQTNLVAISLAVIGTLIIVAFNFSTRSIWRSRRRNAPYGLQIGLLKGVWLMAIGVDLWTSMTCNAWFISPNLPDDSLALFDLLATLTVGQRIIVIFVTLVTVVSPMLVGYLRDKDIDFLVD